MRARDVRFIRLEPGITDETADLIYEITFKDVYPEDGFFQTITYLDYNIVYRQTPKINKEVRVDDTPIVINDEDVPHHEGWTPNTRIPTPESTPEPRNALMNNAQISILFKTEL